MKLRDIVKKHSPHSIDETYIRDVIGCLPVSRSNCDADDCRACWDQEYCPAEDCISCDNVDCILHPGDGDD